MYKLYIVFKLDTETFPLRAEVHAMGLKDLVVKLGELLCYIFNS